MWVFIWFINFCICKIFKWFIYVHMFLLYDSFVFIRFFYDSYESFLWFLYFYMICFRLFIPFHVNFSHRFIFTQFSLTRLVHVILLFFLTIHLGLNAIRHDFTRLFPCMLIILSLRFKVYFTQFLLLLLLWFVHFHVHLFFFLQMIHFIFTNVSSILFAYVCFLLISGYTYDLLWSFLRGCRISTHIFLTVNRMTSDRSRESASGLRSGVCGSLDLFVI